MTPVMTVHAYRVHATPPAALLADSLAHVIALPIEDRVKTVGTREMRLEQLSEPAHGRPYWLADFTNMRFEHGPGRVSASQPIRGFSMEEDEGFGEETALLFDPVLRHCVVQYNHYGPRAQGIAEYLSMFEIGGQTRAFEFFVRMASDAEARFARKQQIKSIQFKVASPLMNAGLRNANIALGRSLEVSDQLNGQSVEVRISAKRGALDNDRVRQLVQTLRQAVANGPDHGPVETLRVSGKDDIDAESEVIDFLMPKLQVEVDGLELGRDHRYTRESRWGALRRARNGWLNALRAP